MEAPKRGVSTRPRRREGRWRRPSQGGQIQGLQLGLTLVGRRREDGGAPLAAHTPIPREEIYPEYKGDLTLAPNPLPEGVYIKQPRLAYYAPEGNGALASHLSNEAHVYEALRLDPHPNIGQYYGCIVENGRITGIALKHYDSDLEDTLEKGPVSKEQCLNYL